MIHESMAQHHRISSEFICIIFTRFSQQLKINSSQIASTIAAFLSIEYQSEKPIAPLIKTMFYD